MSQRVNIQYSIDLERIPDEIKAMVSYSLMRLSELNDICTKMNSDIDENIACGDYLKVLNFIYEIRKSIADIDYRLDDCTKLATAHQGYLTNQFLPEDHNNHAAQPPAEHPPESYSEPPPSINEIQSKISKLRNMVESAEDDE